jgi:hypothetical protein
VLIDDHMITSGQRRPGHPKRLPDAELMSPAVAKVLPGARSEHHWLSLCYGWLGHLFPCPPRQPGYHKRVKAAAPLICKPTFYLATLCPSWASDLRLIDATLGALQHVAGNRQALGAGRVGELRAIA